MNNAEKVQAALAELRKRWMETHGGKTPTESRHPAINNTNDSDEDLAEASPVEFR